MVESLRISARWVLLKWGLISVQVHDIYLNLQILLYIGYNTLNKYDSPEGYALLRLLRSYNNLNILLSFEVQTTWTLSLIQCETAKFANSLKVCKAVSKTTVILIK